MIKIFSTILEAINIIGLLKKKPTPEVGHKLQDAAKNLLGIGASVNALSAGAVATFPEETFKYVIDLWTISPYLGSFVLLALTAINIAPHFGAYALNLAGKTQIEGNPDVVLNS